VAPNTKVLILKINTQVWLSYIEDHNTKDERKEYGAKDRYLSEPQKGTSHVIVTKFGGHALHHLAFRLANVVRQGGRQTKNLVLAIFKKSTFKLLQLLHSFMHYIMV